MKLPQAPKPLSQLLSALSSEAAMRLIQAQAGPLIKGAYLHWDELRRRASPEGLSHEQWWVAVKLARQGLLQTLPLLDRDGLPFSFGMPEPVLIHLHHIDQDAAGQIRAGSEVVSPERRDEFLLRSLIEEAVNSSQLEGASTTRRVAVAMLREGRKPRDHSERMIFNNFRTLRAIQDIKRERITPARLLELHSLLTEGTLEDPQGVGRFRQSDEIRVVNNEDGTILHQPPSFREIPERMERICRFANAQEDERPFVHPVIRAILLHFMIGYDHPFEDGNGRTARALFYWSMLQSGYWLTEFLSISRILKAAPVKYGRAYLHTESDAGDTTYFLLHQLETTRSSISDLHEFLARKMKEQSSVEALIHRSPTLRSQFNHRQRALLVHALKHPGEAYTIEGHRRSHNIVYQTARTDLLGLAALGLLEPFKEGKTYMFLVPLDIGERLAKRGAESGENA